MVEPELLCEHDWRRLGETVRRGSCILVLGPAAAVDPEGDDPTPLTTLLARSFAHELGDDQRIVNRDDLAHVAQLYKEARDRVDLELAVDSFYSGKYDGKTTPLHRALAELPFGLCISTTPDCFMEQAFKDANKEPRIEYYHYQKGRSSAVHASNDICHRRPVIFELYGSRRDKESLVLTESDLLNFLVNVISRSPPLPSHVASRFSDPKVSLLFVGFGFRNWYVRILLHVLKAHGTPEIGSIALEEPAFFDFTDPERRKTAVFFSQAHRIAFKRFARADFVTELKRRRETLSPCAAEVTAPPATAPLAFLSYSHDDHDNVEPLKEELERAGIRLWLDRQKLRGGDDWDHLIPQVLKRVDYVIVVQTPRLQYRVESYVYKEVRIALNRQTQFAEGYRFIIPTKLESCDGLTELAHLHFLDLRTGGVKMLATSILEDWSRPGRAVHHAD